MKSFHFTSIFVFYRDLTSAARLMELSVDDDQQIQVWLDGTWKESASGAIWRNIGGYNVAVMPDDRNDGKWKARIKKDGPQGTEEWFNDLSSELDAKSTALEELLKIQARS